MSTSLLVSAEMPAKIDLLFKARIRASNPPIGALVTLSSPEVAEALSMTGLDWLLIDLEHGPLDIPALQGLVRATRHPCSTLVRIPENSPLWIKKVLDTGCNGVIVPMVRCAAEAREAVEAARYPPLGHRSIGIARAHGYGLEMGSYLARANDDLTIILQIEHIDGVESIGEILKVEGIDGVLIGPNDLAGSMNHLGETDHPEVRAAVNVVRRACSERDMPVGMFVLHPEGVRAELARGMDFLAVGTDVSYLIDGARRALAAAREE